MSHNCKALLVCCMDFRFQTAIANFAKKKGLEGQYDLFSIAGTQKTFIDEATQTTALKQVELSQKLHGSTDVYLIAHWDCGAYGGIKAFDSEEKQKQTYFEDLEKAKSVILENFENLTVHKYLANLAESGEISFEMIA
ncbi:MAG TPA: carbonic anhydrase [Candidatus Bipolaricaulota bacterium]|nr:carbonic anhydrase [Candidatus Bipolaricaulota bacterium]